jgi:hypothetical protein
MRGVVLAVLALATLTGTAQANDALLDQVAIYGPINAIALPCHVEAVNMRANMAMLEAVKTDKEAAKLLAKIHWETQTTYRRMSDKGKFCKNFAKLSDGHAKAAK